MSPVFRRFLTDTSAATAIEYGLIAALIACALIGTLHVMTGKMNDNFGQISSALR